MADQVPNAAMANDDVDRFAFEVAKQARAYLDVETKRIALEIKEQARADFRADPSRIVSEQQAKVLAFDVAQRGMGYAAAVVGLIGFLWSLFGWAIVNEYKRASQTTLERLQKAEEDLRTREAELQRQRKEERQAFEVALSAQTNKIDTVIDHAENAAEEATKEARSVGTDFNYQRQQIQDNLADAMRHRVATEYALKRTTELASDTQDLAKASSDTARQAQASAADVDEKFNEISALRKELRKIGRRGTFVVRANAAAPTELYGFFLEVKPGKLRRAKCLVSLVVRDTIDKTVVWSMPQGREMSMGTRICLPSIRNEIISLTWRYGISNWPRMDIMGVDVQADVDSDEARRGCPLTNPESLGVCQS